MNADLLSLARVAAQFNLSLVVTFSKFLQDEMAFSALRQWAQPEEMFAALNKIACVEPARPMATKAAFGLTFRGKRASGSENTCVSRHFGPFRVVLAKLAKVCSC